jgi:hypothetical protein
MTAPLGSVTLPESVASSDCARELVLTAPIANKAKIIATVLNGCDHPAIERLI